MGTYRRRVSRRTSNLKVDGALDAPSVYGSNDVWYAAAELHDMFHPERLGGFPQPQFFSVRVPNIVAAIDGRSIKSAVNLEVKKFDGALAVELF